MRSSGTSAVKKSWISSILLARLRKLMSCSYLCFQLCSALTSLNLSCKVTRMPKSDKCWAWLSIYRRISVAMQTLTWNASAQENLKETSSTRESTWLRIARDSNKKTTLPRHQLLKRSALSGYLFQKPQLKSTWMSKCQRSSAKTICWCR